MIWSNKYSLVMIMALWLYNKISTCYRDACWSTEWSKMMFESFLNTSALKKRKKENKNK